MSSGYTRRDAVPESLGDGFVRLLQIVSSFEDYAPQAGEGRAWDQLSPAEQEGWARLIDSLHAAQVAVATLHPSERGRLLQRLGARLAGLDKVPEVIEQEVERILEERETGLIGSVP